MQTAIHNLSGVNYKVRAGCLKKEYSSSDDVMTAGETAQMLKTSYRIGHTTLQVETHPDNGCALAPDDVV